MRELDPREVGEFVGIFRTMWETGVVKAVDIPVDEVVDVLASEANGLLVEMVRRRDATGAVVDEVTLLDSVG